MYYPCLDFFLAHDAHSQTVKYDTETPISSTSIPMENSLFVVAMFLDLTVNTLKGISHKSEIPSPPSLETKCKSSRDDAWAAEVEMRISGCTDLVAAESEYHRQFRQNFYTEANQASQRLIKRKLGNKNEELDASFSQLCTWLEQQAEVFTLTELEEKMREFTETGLYCQVVEKKLKERYIKLVIFCT